MIFRRMIRAARLESAFYAEIADDGSATNEALLVVILYGLANGLGQLGQPSGELINGLVRGLLIGLSSWVLWSAIAYFVATRVFKAKGNFGAVLRCAGFAFSPGVLLIFLFVPVIGVAIFLAAYGLMLVAGVYAMRNALNIRTAEAVSTNVISGVGVLVIISIEAQFLP